MQIAPPEECNLFWTNTDVYAVDDVDEDTDLATELSPAQSGGTDMQAGIIVAAETMPELSAIIVITDGYTHFDDEPPVDVPVLWCMTTDVEAPYGTNIKLED